MRRKKFGKHWYRLERTVPHSTAANWFKRKFEESGHRVKIQRRRATLEIWICKIRKSKK